MSIVLAPGHPNNEERSGTANLERVDTLLNSALEIGLQRKEYPIERAIENLLSGWQLGWRTRGFIPAAKSVLDS